MRGAGGESQTSSDTVRAVAWAQRHTLGELQLTRDRRGEVERVPAPEQRDAGRFAAAQPSDQGAQVGGRRVAQPCEAARVSLPARQPEHTGEAERALQCWRAGLRASGQNPWARTLQRQLAREFSRDHPLECVEANRARHAAWHAPLGAQTGAARREQKSLAVHDEPVTGCAVQDLKRGWLGSEPAECHGGPSCLRDGARTKMRRSESHDHQLIRRHGSALPVERRAEALLARTT
jgi:hypothetical protein